MDKFQVLLLLSHTSVLFNLTILAKLNLKLSILELDKSIQKYLKYHDWYVWTNMDSGKITLPIFQSLEAFWPGVQVFFLLLSPE